MACQKGHVEAINALLNAGADCIITDNSSLMCIHHAVAGGCGKETLQAIINYGANVNAADKNSVTALMMACGRGNVEAINALLNAGADSNMTNTKGLTCIHYAVVGGCSKQTLQPIIDHGADINAINEDDLTALMIACQKGNVEAINVLLNAGGDSNVTDTMGSTWIHHAAGGICSKVTLQAIIDRSADVNATNNHSTTALMMACERRNAETVNVLLQAGADPNIADTEGFTSIQIATLGGCNKETLQAVIDYGADVNAANKNSITALMMACGRGNVEAINALLNAGADSNITNTKGLTCIHYAVVGGCSKQTLQAIVDHGADINATNEDNLTALMGACQKGNVEAINVLLNAGADSNITDTKGLTWIHHAACGICSKATLQVIIDHGANVNATNKNSVTALILACGVGNVEAINALLNAGADHNIADTEGHTVIHYAVIGSCNKETLQAICDYGADVNAANKDNVTALMIACSRRNVEAINALLNAGADSNISNNMGLTCIDHAVAGGCSKETLQTIINHGADVNAINMGSVIALMSIETINVLLKAGGDPNIADAQGLTWIHQAVGMGCNIEILQTIIDHGADVNATNNYNISPLMTACQTGNAEAINVLFNAGADPSIADFNGVTLIHQSVVLGCNKKTLQTIINHGADVNAIENKHLTALMLACQKGNVNAINVLLKAGADHNVQDITGATLIHHAAVAQDYSQETLQTIINHGVDVNATNNESVTALMTACQQKNVEAIHLLLKAGADPNIADTSGATSIHHAVVGGCSKETLQFIIDNGADVNTTNEENTTALMAACQKGNVEAINTLVNAGADPNTADTIDATWIHHAFVGCCSKDTLQAVIENGADVNATDMNSTTALMLACQEGNMEVINVLLNAGADINIVDTKGLTWIHHAVVRGGNKETLQAIINYGANVNATNKENMTALMYACSRGNVETINVLLNAGANPVIADTKGFTCIHYAVYGDCDKDTLQALIYHGSDVNATIKDNMTALMQECQKGNVHVIEMLLKVGADPNIACIKGYTCIHFVLAASCCKESLQAVIDHGANVNATSNDNTTVLNACLCKKKCGCHKYSTKS